jgi:hypothetical protein
MYKATSDLNDVLLVWQMVVGESVGFDEGLAVGDSVGFDEGLAVGQIVTTHQFRSPLVDTGVAIFVQPEEAKMFNALE